MNAPIIRTRILTPTETDKYFALLRAKEDADRVQWQVFSKWTNFLSNLYPQAGPNENNWEARVFYSPEGDVILVSTSDLRQP